MKLGIDILCASQVATSIRGLSMDHEASSSSTIHLGCGGSSGRAIDRHNPIIRDATRLGKVLLTSTPPPCFSSDDQPPINNIPKPHQYQKNSRKNNSLKENTPNHHQSKKIISNDIDDVKRKSTTTDHRINSIIRKSSWSCTKPAAAAADFVSPLGSSRYLLSTTQDHKSFSSEFDLLEPYSKISQAANITNKDDHHQPSSFSSASIPTDNSSSSSPPDQVIVLSVSLHCKGCERKMKKHLSKMEGVTSFDIDFKAKKLTVFGDVTPLALLASVSKVKNAQLLTLPVASSTPKVCSNVSEIKREGEIVA